MENETTATTIKVTASDTVISMLRSINNNRKDDFYAYAELYLKSLGTTGGIYYSVKTLLAQRPRELKQLNNLPSDTKKLIIQTELKDENVYLNQSIKSLIDELSLEWDNAELYKQHNLGVRNKIILYGATGNGKTTVAKHIARYKKLPFVEINSGQMIDGHVGATGRNIQALFENIKEPCVVFWDEIDSIAKKRKGTDGSGASVENERMVNAMLIGLEKLNENVIFIAATNFMEALDSAFLRRFDVKYELLPPTEVEKQQFASQLIKYYNLPDQTTHPALSQFDKYSEIKELFVGMARKHVLQSISQ